MEAKEKKTYPMIKLKGKDYLEVKYRIQWFRDDHPLWPIETKIIHQTETFATVKAAVRDEKGMILATAHKTETEAGFKDFLEKAETGAIGRALAILGYGTVNAIDLEEGERVVDAPVASKKQKKAELLPQILALVAEKKIPPEYMKALIKNLTASDRRAADLTQSELEKVLLHLESI